TVLLRKIFWPQYIVAVKRSSPQYLVWSENFCNRTCFSGRWCSSSRKIAFRLRPQSRILEGANPLAPPQSGHLTRLSTAQKKISDYTHSVEFGRLLFFLRNRGR